MPGRGLAQRLASVAVGAQKLKCYLHGEGLPHFSSAPCAERPTLRPLALPDCRPSLRKRKIQAGDQGLRAGSSNCKRTGPVAAAPSATLRAATDCTTQPSSSWLPTR